MLKVIDITQTPPEVENPYPYPLDPFQKFAIHAIDKHENVLVTAKTGSGKTLVGEYQIRECISRGRRVFYTTPIKSLSNQKFNDLKEMDLDVGIMTGDVKFAPQAQVVVMTTEILCNLLYKRGTANEQFLDLSLDDVGAVVFDEVHYINDPDRGKVWEQCLMLLPKGINLVLLSATIAKPEPFGEWLASVRGTNVHLISTTYRIVPLVHMIDDQIIMDSRDKFYPDIYTRWLKKLEHDRKQLKDHKDQVRDRRLGGYDSGPVERGDVRDHSFLFQMNQKVRELQEKNLLPALFFSFSRTKCEEYASKVEPDLLTSSETSAVNNIVEFHLHRYPHVIGSPQCHALRNLLRKGIAFHHSGLLPMLKEIVEILFAKGFIKLLFATETFAVGINMPTKTVVFTSFKKHDEHGLRMLRTDEYIQMAGRAGRRGKDDKGFVYYLPDREPSTLLEVQQMMTGAQMTVQSKMKFDYDFLLKAGEQWKDIAEKSYWRQQHRKLVEKEREEVENLEIYLENTRAKIGSENVSDLYERCELELKVKNAVNAAKQDAQRQLEQWKNRHMGPFWKSMWDIFQELRVIEERYHKMKDQLEYLEAYESEINQKIRFLSDHEFDKLPLSQMAANIHEGHVILTPIAFNNKLFHNLSPNQLIGCLASFIPVEKAGEKFESYSVLLTDDAKLALKKMGNIAEKMAKDEQDMQIEFSNWTINYYWIDVVIEWMNGVEVADICKKYELYEGNFVRTMLKIANIVDEWVTLATITSDLETLDILRNIRPQIVRGVVVPDSLYLRL
jgi:superfamily II RNA helicase